MCGLFAGVGKLNSNRIIALGSMNEERGTDSVGLAYPSNDGVTVAKVAQRAIVGLNITLKKAVTEAAIGGLFIGHTRQATKGAVNDRNAHPFLADGIAFAHNGIIFNDDVFGKYEVDSESLIYGIKARDFSKYDGIIALVWIEEGKLKAYRCGNPLYRGRFAGGLYLASSQAYLKAVGCTHIKSLSEGFIYTFNGPTRLTTEKVNKNNTLEGYSAFGVGKCDYAGSKWITQYSAPKEMTPAERQANWAGYEREGYEDFRTESDIHKARSASERLDRCEVCGEIMELIDGEICQSCKRWMADNGMTEKDLLSILPLRRV